MDDYPAADPIPDPSNTRMQHEELMDFLQNSSDMRKAAKSSMKQALYAGGAALMGGFLLGPIGGMVGGVAGSIVGYFKADNYDGAVMCLNELEPEQKKLLVKRVGQVLVAAGATTSQLSTQTAFRDTLVNLCSSPGVRDDVWNACVQTLQE
eukprot:scaffold1525_cov142-Cylindrotheca_fusiformis.AAC.41